MTNAIEIYVNVVTLAQKRCALQRGATEKFTKSCMLCKLHDGILSMHFDTQ
jgi:hypothetical protein